MSTEMDHVITRNGISMRIEKVPSNPVVCEDNGSNGVEHYRCTLNKTGKQLKIYVSIHTAEETLSASDVMFMLAMDAFGCRLLDGYENLRDKMDAIFAGSDGNLSEIEEFWVEYGGRCRQTRELREFLGEPVYQDLLRQFDMDGGMPPAFNGTMAREFQAGA